MIVPCIGLKIIKLVPRQLPSDIQTDKLGTVAVAMVLAFFHRSIDPALFIRVLNAGVEPSDCWHRPTATSLDRSVRG